MSRGFITFVAGSAESSGSSLMARKNLLLHP